jgi:hypothetical protein
MTEQRSPGEEPSAETPAPETEPAVPGGTLSASTSEGSAAGPMTPPAGRPAGAGGLPRWVPLALLAIIPALIVGLLVYAIAGDGGGGGGNAAGVIDGFVRSGGPDQDAIESFKDREPPGFPEGFPRYSGSDLVVAFAIRSPQQGSFYIVVYNTGAKPQDVFDFYQRELDRDPWQVEGARSREDDMALRFSRPDSADVQGELNIHRSELDGRTSVYIYFQDVSRTSQRGVEDRTFVLGASRPLPPGFPNDVPIYGDKKSTIIETIFERGPGATNYLVSLLTKDSQDDVMKFYRDEFEKKGWQVEDSTRGVRGFVLSIDFTDGPLQEIQGTIQADLYEDDATYTRVDLLLQVSTRRGRGN